MMNNRYPGACAACAAPVPAYVGVCRRGTDRRWVVTCPRCLDPDRRHTRVPATRPVEIRGRIMARIYDWEYRTCPDGLAGVRRAHAGAIAYAMVSRYAFSRPARIRAADARR